MFFAEYVQKMRTIENPQKGQYSFMIDFLGHCFTEKYKFPLSETTAKRYFKGKTEGTGKNSRVVGDEIGHFAIKHKNHFDSCRLAKYIQEITRNHTYKNTIIDFFKDDIPDLTEGNYPEKLAELCKSLLDIAAGKVDPMVEITEDDGNGAQIDTTHLESISNDLFNIPHGTIIKINDIIIELLTQLETLKQYGEKIADWVYLNSQSMLETDCALWDEFKLDHREFQKLNTRLHVYFDKYNCRIFKYTLPFKDGLAQDCFWERHLMRLRCRHIDVWISDSQPCASDYIEILKEISNELERVLESSS